MKAKATLDISYLKYWSGDHAQTERAEVTNIHERSHL